VVTTEPPFTFLLARSDKIFVGTADAANMLVDYHYNMRGQMDRMDYGNGNFAKFSYDPLGRLEKVWYNDDTTKVAETVYNERGLVGLTKDGFSDTRTRMWYDLAGRVVQMRRTLGAAADTTDLFAEVSYDYEDSTNRLQQQRVRVLTGLDTIYSYTTGYVYGDGDEGESPNRVYAVTYNGETDLQYLYDSLGRVDTRLLADGNIETRYHYASKGYSSRSSTLVRSVAENGLYTYYDYDEMGNIVYMDDSTGRIDTYTYDDLNQLLTANVAGKSYAYTYDAGGNILTAVENGVTHTYTYGNTVWRDLLTAYDGQSITYDQIGNPLTYRNGMRFTWEHGRQLSASLNPNSSVSTYTYNADGTRHSKSTQTNVTKTTTYYYVEGVLYAVESPDYTVVFQFDDTGRPYGFRLLRNDSPGYESQLYYKYNLQGDVVGIYDFTGNEVVTYTYDPWGKLLSADGVDILIDANPLLYRGYVYDKETGFYYCNSRYYDPETGRWINADSVMSGVSGTVQGYNLFAYCMNNPINMDDSSGNWPKWATKLVAAVAVVAVVAAVAAVTVATAGAGSAIAAVAVGAAKGAAIGFAVGAASGAVSGYATTGTLEGALNGMADGALSGSICGTITGGVQGGVGHFSTSGALNPSQVDPRITDALETLDKTGIKPGQTQISQKAVLSKFNSYNPLTASSSYTKINGSLYVSEGHHTMVANVMKYGKLNSGIHMGQMVNDPGVVTNMLWTTLKIMP